MFTANLSRGRSCAGMKRTGPALLDGWTPTLSASDGAWGQVIIASDPRRDLRRLERF